MNAHLLRHFDLAPDDLLGWGGESSVYALDGERVLRVYAPDASLAYIEARGEFYAWLAAQRPPFATPQILDLGVYSGQPYAIERWMHGHDLARVLPRLMGSDRERALGSYLDVATRIGTIHLPQRPFGEILFPDGPIQRDSWSHFLWDRAQQTLAVSRGDLVEDVPQLEQLIALLRTSLDLLEPMTTKALVHGDYFPGNVFVDDAFTIYGVIDFGYSTVVGDPRMDVAGAVIFLEVVAGYSPQDTRLLLGLLPSLAPDVTSDVLDLYRLYYSFYFSHCKRDDPSTYWWCVENLRAWPK